MNAGFQPASHEPQAAAAQAAPPAAATDANAASEPSAGSVTNSETPNAALETPADPPAASPEKPAAEPEASQPETFQPDGSSMAPASESAPAAEPQLDSDASAADTAADAVSVPEATASETAAPSAPPTPKTPAQSQSESTRSQQELLAATLPASQPSPRLPPMHSRQQQTKGGLPAEGGQSEASIRLLACPCPSSARPHAVVSSKKALHGNWHCNCTPVDVAPAISRLFWLQSLLLPAFTGPVALQDCCQHGMKCCKLSRPVLGTLSCIWSAQHCPEQEEII